MTFGQFLVYKRKERNLTLSEVSKRSGISKSYISYLERDQKENPHPQVIRKIAKGINIPVCDVLEALGVITEEETIEWAKTRDGVKS